MGMRQYQCDAANSVIRGWKNGNKKELLVLPTGTGKTVVFSNIAAYQAKQGRVLIMAHRDELLSQASDKLFKFTGKECALEKASKSCIGEQASIVVGSVQTLSRKNRLDKFPNNFFDTIIVDEAHHCLSDTYLNVLNHFPDANVLGVTATADRGDKRNLGQYFDEIAYEYSMRDAIKDGWLVPLKAQMIPLELDISKVGVTAGDFAVNAIDTALDPYLEQIADEMVNYAMDRKTVVFLPLIRTSQKFCEMLNKRGFKAVEVNGQSDDRAQVLKDYDQDKYNVLCNSMLLTEGWDCPSVDCIVVLRPTKVRALYQQMVGRGTRPCEGKKDLLLLDFLWLTDKHDLCKPSSLLAKKEDIANKMDAALLMGEEIDLCEAEEQAEADVQEEREKSLAKQLEEQRAKRKKLVDPLQYAMSIADEDLADYIPTFMWEMGPATEKQLQTIENFGLDADAVRNKGEASLIIDKLMKRRAEGLATPKQIRCLEKFGFKRVGTWSLHDATNMVKRLAANHWNVPCDLVPELYKPKGA